MPMRPQVPEWVQVAGLALSAASSILGGVSSASAARKAERLRRQQDAKNDAWFAKRYNESYIDTAAGRNAIRQAQDYGKRMVNRAEGAAAVAGGTDAATAQAKESANKMMGDTIGNLAAQDTARKDAAEATHMQQEAQSTSQQMQTQQQRGAAIAQAAQGASNALIQGAAMLGESPSKIDKQAVGRMANEAYISGLSEYDGGPVLRSGGDNSALSASLSSADAAEYLHKTYAERHGLTTG